MFRYCELSAGMHVTRWPMEPGACEPMVEDLVFRVGVDLAELETGRVGRVGEVGDAT